MKAFFKYLLHLAAFMLIFIAHQLWFRVGARSAPVAIVDGFALVLFSYATLWAWKKL